MSGPTPGAWVAARWHAGWFVVAPNPAGDNHRVTIAESREATLGALYGHQAEANARLIAAAPDLLAALEELLDAEFREAEETLDFGPGGTMEEVRAHDLIDARRAAARAAIAAARGESRG